MIRIHFRWQLFASFTLITILAIGLALFNLWRTDASTQSRHEIAHVWLPQITTIGVLRDSLDLYRTAQLEYMLPVSVSRRATLLARMNSAFADLQHAEQTYAQGAQATKADTSELTLANEFSRDATALDKITQDSLVMQAQQTKDIALLSANTEARPLYERMSTILATLTQTQEAGANTTVANADKDDADAQAVTLGALALVTILSIGLAIFLTLFLSRRVAQLSSIARRIGEGNLNVRVIRPGRDDLGQLGQALNTMASRLDTVLTRLVGQRDLGQHVSHAVHTRVVQVVATATEQTEAMRIQVEATLHIGQAIDELGSTARYIAQTTETVADTAKETAQQAMLVKEASLATGVAMQQSRAVVAESMTGIASIAGRMERLTTELLVLAEHAVSVNEVLKLITAIADETHMLAINAAIEAADTAQQHRFRVVAGEVKNLAARVRTAADATRELIRRMQDAVGRAVLTSEEGRYTTAQVTAQSVMVQQTMDHLQTIIGQTSERIVVITDAIQVIENRVEDIRIATAQQQSANDQVIPRVHAITEVASQNSKALTNLTATISDLETDVQGLVSALERGD